eukprot:COSAG01_NODE_4151_length_5283_cov_3.521371_4_plen_432_part_00
MSGGVVVTRCYALRCRRRAWCMGGRRPAAGGCLLLPVPQLALRASGRAALIIMPARGASATMAWAVAGAIAATMGQPGWALEWGVILDCGSSHTATHIYKWGPGQPMQEFVPPRDAELLQNNTMAMTDPAFVSDAVQLRAYFARLVKQAARWVPADKQATTPIRAYATAGMRLLNAATQESLWVHVRAQLSGSATPFAFLRADDAQTISGNMEGIFAYLAVNFILSGAPAAKTQERVGALDLGGASTQITFASSSGGSIMADAYRAGVGGRHATRCRLLALLHARRAARSAAAAGCRAGVSCRRAAAGRGRKHPGWGHSSGLAPMLQRGTQSYVSGPGNAAYLRRHGPLRAVCCADELHAAAPRLRVPPAALRHGWGVPASRGEKLMRPRSTDKHASHAQLTNTPRARPCFRPALRSWPPQPTTVPCVGSG